MEKQGIERRGLVALLAGSVLAMATRPSLADDAIDPEAKEAVAKMGKTLSTTGAFSFRSYAIRQYEKDNLPLHIFHSAEVLVRRPDRLMVDINGDDGQAKIGYDGKTLTVYSATANKYAQMQISGSIETMFRAASERMGVDFPLADLLADQPGQAFLDGVLTGKQVGEVTIDGQKCNHFFFLDLRGSSLSFGQKPMSVLCHDGSPSPTVLFPANRSSCLRHRIGSLGLTHPTMRLSSRSLLVRPRRRAGHNEKHRSGFAGRAVDLPAGTRMGCRSRAIWGCGVSRPV